MESIAGMKELNQKLSHIERSLERIAKSLEHLDKVIDRQGAAARPRMDIFTTPPEKPFAPDFIEPEDFDDE